jgi:hypothetical protein
MIGNRPAAVKALGAIATYRAVSGAREAKITIISREMTPYSPVFLAHYLTGEFRGRDST